MLDDDYSKQTRDALTSSMIERVKNIVGNKCEVCGIVLPAGVLNLHHIIPVNEADGTFDYNSPSNLIVLCANCHGLAHRNRVLDHVMRDATYNRSESARKQINETLKERKMAIKKNTESERNDIVSKKVDHILLLFNNKMYSEALNEIKQAAKMNLSLGWHFSSDLTRDCLFEIGDNYFRENKFSEALDYYNQARGVLTEHGPNYMLLNRIADCYFYKNNDKLAIYYYISAIVRNWDELEVDTDDEEFSAYTNLNKILEKKGLSSDEINYFNQCMFKFLKYENNRIEKESVGTFDGKRKYREDDALDKYPREDVIHQRLANIFYKTGKIDDAIEQYKCTIYIAPEFKNAYYRLINCYLKSKYNALDAYKLTIQSQPKFTFEPKLNVFDKLKLLGYAVYYRGRSRFLRS